MDKFGREKVTHILVRRGERKTVEFTTKPSSGHPGHYFATADGFGCSKDYADRNWAIDALIQAECYVRVTSVPTITTTADWQCRLETLHAPGARNVYRAILFNTAANEITDVYEHISLKAATVWLALNLASKFEVSADDMHAAVAEGSVAP